MKPIKQALICKALDASFHENKMAVLAERLLIKQEPSMTVMHDEDIDWEKARQIYGGTSGAYREVGGAFDVLILVESLFGGEGVGMRRGLFSLGEAALAAGRLVLVVRDGQLRGVRALVEHGGAWSGRYATAEVEKGVSCNT